MRLLKDFALMVLASMILSSLLCLIVGPKEVAKPIEYSHYSLSEVTTKDRAFHRSRTVYTVALKSVYGGGSTEDYLDLILMLRKTEPRFNTFHVYLPEGTVYAELHPELRVAIEKSDCIVVIF